MTDSQDARRRLAEASRIVTQELYKQGTPDYDHRAHERAVEAERRAAEAVRAAEATSPR
ncbi:translation initiation factor 2 [Cellulomonas sp. NPDC057328]|uniref:translation initiation factor 2 n=1 Tax=Cellulomonas sp. NPDC057328 TaxID=3346101 RepID=UPI0036377889